MTTSEQETPNKNKRQGKKPQKDLSHIKCFACNKMGHYANKCPEKKEQGEDEDEAEVERHSRPFPSRFFLPVQADLVERRRERSKNFPAYVSWSALIAKIRLRYY
jgi:hypothetical protein